ncbi:SIMPL domain-containing protein [uncultured Peptoniphilus sp.]|uniref:SIMPL domain-containing protein n=1 Tax=uncultured Peptoniphilus sp. TaxID=254354 RepID=UPI00280628BE|nr:SIMPL domain-containing protein [uncultured Peptoniphilus sp.]
MRTIRVTGRGSVSVKPDTTCLKITFEGVYKDYEETVKQSAEKTKILREAIEKSGLHGEDLKTKDFSIESVYESYRDYNDDYKRRFVGYKFHHRTEIQFPNDNKILGRILYELSVCSVKVEFSIGYTVKDKDAVKKEVIKRAVENSREKAEILATAAGVILEEIQSIDYSWGEIEIRTSPVDMFEVKSCKMESSYDIDIEPDDIDVADTVTILWEIK